MRTEPDVTRVVRSWLDEGADRLPDRVLDSVLERLPTTPQRRPLWSARRFPDMNTVARVAVLAVVVVVAAVAGFNLLPRSGVGGPVVTPSPTPTLSPTAPPTPAGPPTASPSPSPVVLKPSDTHLSLTAATYRLPDAFAVPVSLTLPAGFTTANLDKTDTWFWKPTPQGNASLLGFAIPTNAFADPCHADRGPKVPAVGQSVNALVTAMTALKGFTAGPVTDAKVGGYAGKTFVLTNKIDTQAANCSGGGNLSEWTFQGPSGESAQGGNGGARERIWIVQVGTSRVLIDAMTFPYTTAADQLEAEQIVQTIRFE